MRSFLCFWSAHDQNVLARQPQSKASHTLAWSGNERGESTRQRAEWKINQSSSLKRQRASSEGAGISLDARLCGLTGIVLKSRMPMFSSGERSEMRREDRSQGMATAVSVQLVHIRRPQCR